MEEKDTGYAVQFSDPHTCSVIERMKPGAVPARQRRFSSEVSSSKCALTLILPPTIGGFVPPIKGGPPPTEVVT